MNLSDDDGVAANRQPRYPSLTAPLRAVGLLRPYESSDEIRSYATVDRSFRIITGILCALPFVAACIGLAVAYVSVPALKAWVDQLAPDGDAEKFTPERLVDIQVRVAVASAGWLLLGVVGTYIRYRFPGPMRNGLREITRLPSWLRRRLQGMPRIDKVHLGLVVAMTLIAAVAAATMLAQPARIDEAGTYVRYVAKPPLYIVSVYNKSNNHILHNLLAWLCVNVFGDGLVQLRLPTFVAGTLLLPSAYVAVRRHHGRSPALLAIALLASSVVIVDGSTNARGYQLLLLAFVVLIAALPSVVRGEQWAWLAFVLTTALGFWVVPIMVYPAVIVGVWLCIARFRDKPRNPKTFLVRLAVAVVSVVVIVASLYSPAQAVSDATAVVSTQSTWGVHASLVDTLLEIPWRANELATIWRHGRPDAVHWLMIGGLALSPFVAHRTGRYGARLLWSTVVALLAILAATKVYPPFWSLTFLYVLWVALASVGIVGALSFVRASRDTMRWTHVGLAVAIFGLSVGSTFDARTLHESPGYVGYPDAGPLVDEIAEPLLDGARIDISFISGSTLNYYMWRADPRLFYELRPTSLEGEPDDVFLVIPRDRVGPESKQRLEHYVAQGYVESEPRTWVGDSEVIRFGRRR